MRRVDAAAVDAVAGAGEVLREGGVVALPTDTVYGVAASLARPAALRRLYAIKGRANDKPLPVLLADRGALGQVVAGAIAPGVEALMGRYWPGPLTLVLPAREGLPGEVVGPGRTVGVRVPDHSVARAVVAAAGGALAVTSANRSGGAAATTADAVAAELGGGIDLLLDGGDAIGGVASTVAAIGEDGPRVLRLGAVTARELAVAWAGGVGAVLPR